MPVGSLAACLRGVPLAASIFSWALNPYAHLPSGILPVSQSGPEEAVDEAVGNAEPGHDDPQEANEEAQDGAQPASSFAAAPAMRYARLSPRACERELTRRKIPWKATGPVRGVLAPVRLTGPLHGVSYHSALPEKKRATSIYEVVDCRLALALDDLSQILTRYDIVEVIHMSAYRPPRAKHWVDGRLGKRHGAAMAMDMGTFKRKDGTSLSVLHDFHGRVGAHTCGPHARGPRPATPEAVILHKIACETADAHLFNVELTPDFNRAHKNHFHLEVSQHPKWFYLR